MKKIVSMEDNVYYNFFRASLNSEEGIEQDGGKFYNQSIGHVYAAPRIYRGRGVSGPAGSVRGFGIGDVLGKIFQWTQPLLKKLGQKVIDSASNFAVNVASDAVQGENIIESAKKHASVEGKQLLREVPQDVGSFLTREKEVEPVETGVKPSNRTSRATLVARNATRASSKRSLSKKKTGRGVKKQKGSGIFYSPLYPALRLMKD